MFLFLKEQHERHFHLKFMYFCSPIEKNRHTNDGRNNLQTWLFEFDGGTSGVSGFYPSTEDAVHAEMPVDHRTSQPFGNVERRRVTGSGRDCGRAWLYVAMPGRRICLRSTSKWKSSVGRARRRQSIRHRQTDSPRQILAYMEYRYHHSTRTTGFYCSCR